MLRSDPDKLRAWQQRSRSNLSRSSGLRQQSSGKAERRASIAAAGLAARVRYGYRCAGIGLVPGGCDGPLDAHHVFARSARPDLVADTWNLVPLCRKMHDWVGDHPAEANRLGLHAFTGDSLDELAERRRIAL